MQNNNIDNYLISIGNIFSKADTLPAETRKEFYNTIERMVNSKIDIYGGKK